MPKGASLAGLKIVVDCANGAAYKIAPQILWELEAEVISIADRPNGRNINDGVGSTHPERAAQAVLDHQADLGICLDGDADRVILIDEKGRVADGDQLMALMAGRWAEQFDDAHALRFCERYVGPKARTETDAANPVPIMTGSSTRWTCATRIKAEIALG